MISRLHAAALVLLSVASPLAIADFRTVAVVGEIAPGGAEVFASISPPTLNEAGEVVFAGELDNDDFSSGIWSEGDGVGSLRNVVSTGNAAPDTGGALFDSFPFAFEPLLFNGSDIAFAATLDDGRAGLFTDRQRIAGTPLSKIALEGDSAPGADSGGDFTFNLNLQALGGTHSGTAFVAGITGTPGDNAIYSEGANVVLSKIVEAGNDAPGTMRSLGGIAQFEQFGPPAINNVGDVAFWGNTNASTGFDAMGDAGIWTTSRLGPLREVALQGQPAPGTETTFSQIFGHLSNPLGFVTTPSMNHSGQIAFVATLTQFDGVINAGIWAERSNEVEKVVVEGDIGPLTGLFFDAIVADPLINEFGAVAFLAEMTGGVESIWLETAAGQLRPIALVGTPAPDTTSTFLNLQSIGFNDSSHFAFQAELADFSTAIYTGDEFGVLEKVVASGDVIAIDAGLMLVEQVEFAGHSFTLQASGAGGFNNAGQVAFYALGELVDELMQPTGESVEGAFVFTPSTSNPEGDYDDNGVVDMRDYNVWRDNLGATAGSLPNDTDGGPISEAQYLTWRNNFGTTASLRAETSPTPVPEPSTLLFVGIVSLAVAPWRRQLSQVSAK